MLRASFFTYTHQQKILTHRIQAQMQQNYTGQLESENRFIRSLSSIIEEQDDNHLNSGQFSQSLQTYFRHAGIDFVTLRDDQLNPVAAYGPATLLTKLTPESAPVFQKNSKREVTYYGWSDNILYRVIGIEIIRNDSLAKKLQNAYLFFGLRFDQQQLTNIATLTGGEATLFKEPEFNASKPGGNEIISQVVLQGSSNYPIACIQLKTKSLVLRESLISDLKKDVWIISAVAALLILILIFIRRYYQLPIKELKQVLTEKNPERFHSRNSGNKEIETVKNQIFNIFSQQNILVEFIKRQPSIKIFELHAAILDHISEVVYVTDMDDKIIFWNQAAENYYHIPQQDAIQKTASQLLPILWENENDSLKVKQILKEQGSIEGYFTQKTPHGQCKESQVKVIRIFDCTNKPSGNIFILKSVLQETINII
ncbi:hypothetical protein MASR1M74_01770 [Lentimicrobium sp.]